MTRDSEYRPTAQDVLLRYEIKLLTPRMREELLKHAAGKLPYRINAIPINTFAALERRRLITLSRDGKFTIPTAKAAAMIEIMVDEKMKIDEPPALVPLAAEPETV